ncbi:hypothetical protein [Promicromonospora sukumoe]|uniref:hypothetical protein n=1 Tax=Promicromonospora sukumoe TaxID=88382 RepID=UPI00036B3DAB|nr:hypothetical protein [Promicromonospora sukumoe]
MKPAGSIRFLGLARQSVPAGAESKVLDALQEVLGNTLVTAGAENVDLTQLEGVDRMRQIAQQEAVSACMDEWQRLDDLERKALIADIKAPNGRHVCCAIAALIGEVCTWPGKLVGDAAAAVGDRVARRTGSQLAGKIATAMARRLIANVVLQASCLGQAEQIGLTADVAAVAECPSQQAKRRERHLAVEACATRLVRRTVDEAMSAV